MGVSSDPCDTEQRGDSGSVRSTTPTETDRFTVPDMDCPSCAQTVEKSVRRLDGIDTVDTRAVAGTVSVSYRSDETSSEAIADQIEGAGYRVANINGPVEPDGDREEVWKSSRAIKTAIGGAVVTVGLFLEFVFPGLNPVVIGIAGRVLGMADLLFLTGVVLAGSVIFRSGYYSAINRSLDIDLLMSTAIGGAILASLVFGESLYFEAATLTVLFGVAELLEDYSMNRAKASLRELMDLSPDEATIIHDGESETVPVEAVTIGDHVIVRPGEKIPVDGTVRDGESAVDQSPITGESIPVDKTAGDDVYAGTINKGGYLEIQTTAAADDTTLARIVRLVEDAPNQTDREQFVDRFASYYTPVVVAFAGLVALGSPAILSVTWPTAIVYGLTLLVLACPCAFVISTPVSVVSGLTSAAKNGVLVKGGTHLEAIADMNAIAFDKTGTLTTGDLSVTDVVPLNGNDQADVLRCARGLESRSAHPIGEAIVARAENTGTGEREVTSFESLTGRGVRAELDGTTHYAGKPDLFEELGFDLTHVHVTTDGGFMTTKSQQLCERNDCVDLLEETVPQLQAEGKTVILVGTADELEGIIAVADEVRETAAATIDRLRDLGVQHVVMLTGDNERTARAIANEVGVDAFRAELLPDEKVQVIQELDRSYGGVAMVGDGVNDAPALATATVGIAMGAAGSDAALETADVALMNDDLSRLSYLRSLATRTTAVIQQNVLASLAVKAALAIAVPFGYVPIWLAVLAGDAGMTVGVTGNAMRLSRLRPDSN